MHVYSMFHDTMADMTYPEVERAARAGACALWALGVIEQHGPHLPLGTDVYVTMARLRRARQSSTIAASRASSCRRSTGAWTTDGPLPGNVPPPSRDHGRGHARHVPQPEEGRLPARVLPLRSRRRAPHNRTIDTGVVRARAEVGLDAYVILSDGLAKRLGYQTDAAAPRLDADRAHRREVHGRPRRRLGNVDRARRVSGSREGGCRRQAPLHRLPARGPGGVAPGRRARDAQDPARVIWVIPHRRTRSGAQGHGDRVGSDRRRHRAHAEAMSDATA